jgi:CheY-like chemotaxis protein
MSNTPLKVLLIEDDQFLQALAVQKFTKEGFQAISAMDGEHGLALAEKELPDVILLDILLPGIDGFAVLMRIAANPSLKDTRVFMLSNYSQPEDVAKAKALGAERFLIKADYTLDQITDMVKDTLGTVK